MRGGDVGPYFSVVEKSMLTWGLSSLFGDISASSLNLKKKKTDSFVRKRDEPFP